MKRAELGEPAYSKSRSSVFFWPVGPALKAGFLDRVAFTFGDLVRVLENNVFLLAFQCFQETIRFL